MKPLDVQKLLRDRILEQRFINLWQRNLLPDARCEGDQAWAKLRLRYGEEHRHYHDLGHLAHCLEQLDLARESVDRPDEVEMAIWYHDIINEPDSRENEKLSADYFASKARDCMAPDFVGHVVELVLVTTHKQTPANNDQRFICDIDLASFGCPWECFVRDSDAVKAEFVGSDEDYYRGKSAFLRSMLDRPRIFQTDFFFARYEQQSRQNIERLLQLVDAEEN